MDRIKAGFLTAVGVYGMLVAVHVVYVVLTVVQVLGTGDYTIKDLDVIRILQAIFGVAL